MGSKRSAVHVGDIFEEHYRFGEAFQLLSQSGLWSH